MRKSLLGAVAVAALMLPGAALAQSGTIKIGILVALEGAFATGGQDGVRNVELALKQVNNTIAGKKIETVVAPTDTKPDTTVRMARKLVEQDKVDLIIGPLSGSEGIAMRDFAKTIPDKVVINGISGALKTTWVDPAPNFYRFNLDGSQWGFGLGNYVVKKKGWKRVATIAADYSFGYTNFMGFAVDFCKSGGDIVQRFWQPLGQSDFGGIIAQLPDNVDAIYLGLGLMAAALTAGLALEKAVGGAPASSSRKVRSGTRRRMISCSRTCRAMCAAVSTGRVFARRCAPPTSATA